MDDATSILGVPIQSQLLCYPFVYYLLLLKAVICYCSVAPAYYLMFYYYCILGMSLYYRASYVACFLDFLLSCFFLLRSLFCWRCLFPLTIIAFVIYLFLLVVLFCLYCLYVVLCLCFFTCFSIFVFFNIFSGSWFVLNMFLSVVWLLSVINMCFVIWFVCVFV